MKLWMDISVRFLRKNIKLLQGAITLPLLFLLLTSPLFCQENRLWTRLHHQVKFKSLSVEHGLSQSSVLAIYQDSKGFMWFGTQDGLNKYDGNRFITFKPVPGNLKTLKNNIILDIVEDRQHNLWIGTNSGGLNLFDRNSETFTSFTHDTSDPDSLGGNEVNVICEDRTGVLWIGTGGGGLNRLVSVPGYGGKANFVRYQADARNPQSISSNQVIAIYEDHLGTLWIGTEGGGLNKMVRGASGTAPLTFIHFKETDDQTIGLNNAMAIEEDHFGNLWIGTQNGLIRYNPKLKSFQRFYHKPDERASLSHNYIRLIYRDRAGVLWIGTDGGGLNKLLVGPDPLASPEFIRYQYSPDSPFGLRNNAVESIFEDRSGVLWIGLYYGGISKLVLSENNGDHREKSPFLHFQTIANNANSLSHNAVTAICIDRRENLWIGTDGGGLNRVISGKNAGDPLIFQHFLSDPGKANTINDNIVTSIVEDPSGDLWIGTYTGGINRLVFSGNGEGTARFYHYQHNPGDVNSLSNDFIMTIYLDPEDTGILWLGTIGGGLNRFEIKNKLFRHYRVSANKSACLSNDNVTAIFRDSDKNLWVGTVNGLNRLNSLKESFICFQNDPYNPSSISSDFIRVLFEDRSGQLWIGTNGGGLNKAIKSKNSGESVAFVHYREKDGLPNNVVLGILEDDHSNLWLSTNKGISRFDPQKETFKNYDLRDGLQSNEFNRNAYFKGKSGEMFFGGINGFNIFYPDNIKENPYVPEIVITDFQILNRSVPIGKLRDGRTILEKSITETSKIALSYRDYSISFQFSALHFVSPSKNKYAYRMEGLEEGWNQVSDRRFVTYTTLPPGSYTFHVIGSNNDGVWNNKGVSLRIKINPPFWKTWWFYGLIAMLITVTTVSIHFYRVRQIITRERKKYEKTSISPEKADTYFQKLHKYMEENKPHLDAGLTLRKLSTQLDIPHHCLSQIINTRFNKIFFDFINQYRIDEALSIMSNAGEKQKSIPEITQLVGFNSQSAFNRAFKKQTQLTPTDFINQHRIGEAIKKLTNFTYINKTIPEIATLVGFSSQSAFNRAFKKISNQTPTDYSNHFRIEAAIKELADTGANQKSIQAIARELGFGSQSAFNRVFKQFTKKNPSQYRKRKS